MTNYDILIKKSAKKDLEILPKKERKTIYKRIENLAKDPLPRGCKQLRGLKNLYRLRFGNYRIVYQIDNNELAIVVIRVGNRRNVYRSL